jgi:hypothetical protein
MEASPKQKSASIWEPCRSEREQRRADAIRIAERVRAVAQKLRASPSDQEGVWELKCPHCSTLVFIDEVKRSPGSSHVTFREVGRGSCAALPDIMQRVQAVL